MKPRILAPQTDTKDSPYPHFGKFLGWFPSKVYLSPNPNHHQTAPPIKRTYKSLESLSHSPPLNPCDPPCYILSLGEVQRKYLLVNQPPPLRWNKLSVPLTRQPSSCKLSLCPGNAHPSIATIRGNDYPRPSDILLGLQPSLDRSLRPNIKTDDNSWVVSNQAPKNSISCCGDK